MSISYSAAVICGFMVTDLKDVTKDGPTKFNQDTGEPYTTTEYSHSELYVDDVMVAKCGPDYLHTGESLEGLEFGRSGYEEGCEYVGIRVADVSDYGGDFDSFNTDVPAEVYNFAEKYGLEPSWFLALSAG